MKIEIEIPDGLVSSVKTLAKTLIDTLESASTKVKEEVDSFDKDSFKKDVEDLCETIDASLGEIELEHPKDFLGEIFSDIFWGKHEQEPKPKRNMLNELYQALKEIDSTGATWFKSEVNKGNIDNQRANKYKKPSLVLYYTVDFSETPQGTFYWKSVMTELERKGL